MAVAAAVPELAVAPLVLSPRLVSSNPKWRTGSGVVDGRFLVKFAWSEPAAVRVHREALLLETLSEVAPRLPLPRLAGASVDPVAFVTHLVPGGPLGFDDAMRFGQDERTRVADQLASFLAALHAPAVLEGVQQHGPALVEPVPQADTPSLRDRLPRFLDHDRVNLVLGWCDWVDSVLNTQRQRHVLVHADLHGHNQVWDTKMWTLRLIADLEVAGPADPEYDLRYFPGQEPTLALVEAIRAGYERQTGRRIDVDRMMAWHIRTALGDALWRSEAGVELPGGGTPTSYVDDIERKMRLLGYP